MVNNELFVFNKETGQKTDNIDHAELQNSMAEAFKSKDSNKISKARKQYENCYADQLEGVEALFDFQRFFKESDEVGTLSDQIKNENFRKLPFPQQNKKRERLKNLYQSLTEYQFLITHFITENNDRGFLKNFWQTIETAVVDEQHKEKFGQIKRGVVSQVATYRIFKELGSHPTFSHPKEDAFHSIDLWRENNPVQIKTGYKDPELIATDRIVFPSVGVKDAQNRERHFNSNYYAKMQKFQMDITKYREISHKDIQNGYFMVIPSAQIDPDTGEPQSELVQFYKRRLEELDGKNAKKAA